MPARPRVVHSEPGPHWQPADAPLIQISSPDPGALKLTTDPPSWELNIDVSHGDRDLEMVHCEVFGLPGAMLLKVCAEHYRGASLHNHAVWAVSPDGRILWSRPWECSDSLACDDDSVWLIKHVGNQNNPPGVFPLELHHLTIATGEPAGPMRRLRLPADLVGRYQQAWEVNAGFTKSNGDVVVVHDEFRIESPRARIPRILATITDRE